MKRLITAATLCFTLVTSPFVQADTELAKALASIHSGNSGSNILSVKLDDENFLIVVMMPKLGPKFYRVYKFGNSWTVSKM